MSNNPNQKAPSSEVEVGVNNSLVKKNSVRGLPQEKNPRPLCTRRLILVFSCVPMEEREREDVFTYVEVPILIMGSHEGLGEYIPLGGLWLKGRRSSSYFYMFSCPIKERK
jgi:hypothetical protein